MKRYCQPARLVIAALGFLLPPAAWADVAPHPLFSERMVLQQGRKVNIWGTAEKGEQVTVKFRDQQAAGKAGDDGKWLVQIDSKEAGGPFPLSITGKNTVTFQNVLVGEVWVCSGQSNMWWPVATRPGGPGLAGTANPSIRLFTVPQRLSDAPQTDLSGQWVECGPDTLVGFSAVAYYFGRDLQKSLDVPIGLIHGSVGGTGVGQWTSAQSLAEDPALQDLRDRRAKEAAENVKKRERLQPEIDRYEAAVAKAKQAGTEPPPPPRGMVATTAQTSRLYNGMIAPLMPFTIRGVIWYQGEANVSGAGDYQALFSTLIRGWRREWGQGDFPFLFVQLAPYMKIVDQPQPSNWAALREAQLRTSQTVPQTGMVVITDWGHETDIHVKQKEPVGERLALVARALVYGEKLVYSGPLYKDLQTETGKLVLNFTQIGSGLTAKRLVHENIVKDSRAGEGGALHVAPEESGSTPAPLQGFTIAGEDRKFVRAQAEIKGDTVIVSSPEVPQPVAVRYGWADYPTGNLFNRERLPASPFRSDVWPLEPVKPAGR